MTPIEKKILALLKEGQSQSSIAKALNVPRSSVQKVSDNELGVDPASLKSLTNEQITEIHKFSKDGVSRQSMADRYNVSAKVIARALLVKLTTHKNNVTVISLNETLDTDGEFDQTYEVAPGGISKIVDKVGGFRKDENVYVGAWLEDLGKYLVFGKQGDQVGYVPALVKKDQLTALPDSGTFGVGEGTTLATLANSIVESGLGEVPGFKFHVSFEDNLYPLRGKLNAKGQIGFFDPLINRTVRAAMSSVKFIQCSAVEQTVEEASADISTKDKMSNKNLDVFLAKHQILILSDQIVIVKNGKPLTIRTDHAAYDAIAKAIHDQDIDLAYELMEPRKAISRISEGHVKMENGKVYWDGNDITKHSISSRLLKLALKGDGDKVARLVKFMDKVYQNPSAKLVQSGRIFEFMAYADIEIDQDGDILVYKSVRGNYMDKHSGTISNKPGTIVRMTRSFVNDDNSSLCSYGLHVCSLAYLRQCFGNMGQRVVRCKLNPKDIVSITNDYGSSKIRCCEYLVLDDYTTEYNRQYKSIDMEGFYK